MIGAFVAVTVVWFIAGIPVGILIGRGIRLADRRG